MFNELLVISDGIEARVGTLTSSWERFAPWKTVEGEAAAPLAMPQLQMLMRGMFEPRRPLELLRSFIVFEDSGAGVVEKKLAGYHQFHAVERAVEATVASISPDGSRRCGVVWHTQGSGKSLTMVFYAGKLVIHPALENPTIVVLTDRLDLDSQLFGVFARCAELLRQLPVQAEASAQLREKLNVASGGIVFTTIQKFIPEDATPIEPYTALEVNDSAVQAMGNTALKAIARELTETLRNNVAIDWTVHEGVRAKMRVLVKRILRRHGYPPDKQEQATKTVIEQAELLSATWAI